VKKNKNERMIVTSPNLIRQIYSCNDTYFGDH
jgi:hypothetical protein